MTRVSSIGSAASERERFKEAEIAGEIVTPPAGAVGRGDAFILKIAQRIGAVVLSNDSFQEFHEQYPWLFDEGRLIGGQARQGRRLGVHRAPTGARRQVSSRHRARSRSWRLHCPRVWCRPSATLSRRSRRRVPPNVAVVKAEPVTKTSAQVKVAKKAARSEIKEPKETRVSKEPKTVAGAGVAPAAKSPRTAKKAVAAKKTSVKKVAPAPLEKQAACRSHKTRRRRRSRFVVDVNLSIAEGGFAAFVKQFKIGATLTGEVVAFTSHGAVIKVTLKNGDAHRVLRPDHVTRRPRARAGA